MAEAHKPPQDFTLRLRRYDPESGEAPYWDEHTIQLGPHRSVLEGILQAKARFDGSIGIRCSCRAAICGSCGVRINGQPGLACHTHLDKALASSRDGVIEVEPMGNMPVIKDLIVDMDAVHWKKIQRVTPWLVNKEPIPEREYIVPRESMIDVTQSMACIQCGACVSDCLSMEVDPLFIGPAALAKAYRFVGDPRDAQQFERLKDLAEDPHGIYDCTHCFKCIEACPKGVAPMSQIMRLRRRAGDDHDINDRNNGKRHEKAFVSLVQGQRPAVGGRAAAALLRRQLVLRQVRAAVGARADRLAAGHHQGAAAAQGHAGGSAQAPQAPQGRPQAGQADLRHRRGARRAHRAQPLHLRLRRGRRRRPPRSRPSDAHASSAGQFASHEGASAMKVAYWPGCVSRGFTPELHGSMAKVAPLLDIELVELDRACCTGAGVIAEHNQELADTLNARTFALAQRVDGAELMMNICSTCQGAQSECQERLDANAEYRDARQRDAVGRGPDLREGPHEQELPLAAGRGDRPRRAALAGQAPADRPQGRARSTAATSCARSTAWASTPSSARATRTWRRSSRRSAARSSSTPARTSAAASRSSR